MIDADNITGELARELLSYEPETGVLTWKPRDRKWFSSDRIWRSWNAKFANTPAGSQRADGYIHVGLLNRKYWAHRLAWLIVRGEWPDADIDHIDGRPSNNKWDNLRDVDRSRNLKNAKRRKDNTSGCTGVSWHRGEQKWRACIHRGRGTISLGYFKNFDAAVAARKAAECKHGFHPNHGRVMV
jgi:hypothetical protein